MNEARLAIRITLATLRRRWLLRLASVLGGGLLAVLALWLPAMVVLDNFAMFSAGGLLIGWAALGAAALAAIFVLARRLPPRWPSAERLALLYERATGWRGDRLINAVQMIRSGRADADPLAAAVVIENAGRLDRAAARRAVDFALLRRVTLIALVGGLLLAGYGWLRPVHAANAVQRLLKPWSPPAHLLDARPVAEPGDIELLEGRPLTIRTILRRNLPDTVPPPPVRLEYRLAAGAWTSVPMESADDGYLHTFPALWQPMRYRVLAGRSASPTYQVSIRRRPRIRGLQVTIEAPTYAGGRRQALKPDRGDVEALVGSTVHLAVTADRPLSAARLDLDDERSVDLTVHRDDPQQARGRFTLERDGRYAIHLADRSPEPLTNPNPPRYTLTAVPDRSPSVLVTAPARDLVLPADAVLPLTLEASDDIGLDAVGIEVRHGEGDWQSAVETTIRERGVRQRAVQTELDLAPYALAGGQSLTYRAVARDYRPPQPNRAEGRTWRISITEAEADEALLADQAGRLLEALRRLLARQEENRTAVDLDRPVEPIRQRQREVRQETTRLADEQRDQLSPPRTTIAELVALADGPMLLIEQRLHDYGGEYARRAADKQRLLALMDEVIERLRALIGETERKLQLADRAAEALEQLPQTQREQALGRIRDMLKKLKDFSAEQDRVIEQTEELARQAEDFTDEQLQRIEALAGTEDAWAEVFTDSVKEIEKLTEQGFADPTLANDYKEMVEQIEAAARQLDQKLVKLAVPREQAGRELAESLAEDMEMWLPAGADNLKWMMEEPLDRPEIPMPELPDQLSDMIGELIEEQDQLNDLAEDATSAWADSISAAGWAVAGGPISNFSGKGKTGNQLPDDNEASGRSGEGRSGRSQGQMLEDVAKGLAGRRTPTRLTNDPYEQGVVKELQQMPTSGATGGGKARGAGQEGLPGQSPPPLYENLAFMQDWQKRIRQKTERVAGQLQTLRVRAPDLERTLALMKQAEQAAADGRYAEMFDRQRMVLRSLRMAEDLTARDVTLRVDRAYAAPPGARTPMLDAAEEPVPVEYQEAVQRYFERLSE